MQSVNYFLWMGEAGEPADTSYEYEELLIASVRKNPTVHNIWMIHRCYNDVKNPLHDKFADLIRELRESANISDEIKNAIEKFTW